MSGESAPVPYATESQVFESLPLPVHALFPELAAGLGQVRCAPGEVSESPPIVAPA